MKILNTIVVGLFAIALSVGSLAGCASKGGEPVEAAPAATEAPAEAPAEEAAATEAAPAEEAAAPAEEAAPAEAAAE
ncbi:hypothetical protein KAI87_01045 [Myxococcota bacterium]|nr:hypothetical protein [Myxococcota bacterium]